MDHKKKTPRSAAAARYLRNLRGLFGRYDVTAAEVEALPTLRALLRDHRGAACVRVGTDAVAVIPQGDAARATFAARLDDTGQALLQELAWLLIAREEAV